MDVIEPAPHLSDAAKAHLRSPETVPPIDYRDPDHVIAARREINAAWEADSALLPGSWASRDETIAGVEVVRYAASSDQLDVDDVIVHIHGGSYLFGSPRANAVMAVPVAQRTELPVLSIDYRLAPEHPCPAGLDDVVAVCESLARAHSIVGVYGESAGGGLAVATAVVLRDRGVTLRRLGLISPWVDLTCSGDSYKTNLGVDPDFPDPDEPPIVAALYASDPADPLASPLFADLTALPPSLIQVGTREVLLSDSCRLDAALRAAGVDSTLDVWDGLWHVWHANPLVPEAQTAFDELTAFLMEDRWN